jgi:hypothetical protein
MRTITGGLSPKSVVATQDGLFFALRILQSVYVGHHPIGITYDAATRQVWVAGYQGYLWVFRDRMPGRDHARGAMSRLQGTAPS